jgi:GTPase
MELSLIPVAPEGFRSGFVGIIGRPNVGKSTLMNHLVGQKIAITSPVAQTTRNRLRGILSTESAQYIFVDTPGIHKPQHQLGEVLVRNAKTAIESVDVVVLMVDGSVPAGRGDQFIVDLLGPTSPPVVIGLNKLDLQQAQAIEQAQATQAQAKQSSMTQVVESYQAIAQERGWPLVQFSALNGDGCNELLAQLESLLDPGPFYYPPDLVTDQPERFIMGELIREQILLLTREEVPHSVAIAIEKVDETPKLTHVMATIHVERDSQKGILIGKGGAMLKAIGSAAREQIQKLIAGKVHLELFVRVQPKWRQSRTRLEEFGYRVE